MFLSLISLAFLFSSSTAATSREFRSPHGPIQNVVLHEGKLYVGSVNGAYSLRPGDLGLVSSASTGPVSDSPFCSMDGDSCLRGHSKKTTDNWNRILLPVPGGLLECGSVHHGSCSLRSLSDLSILHSFAVPVAANSPNASTLALLLPSGLVVASSHTVDSPYREVPTISYRTLSDLLVLNSGSLEGESSVVVRAEFRPLFPQSFVSSFEDEGFVYVAVVQPATARRLPPQAPLITKLARFCVGDERFTSYSEVEVQCRADDNSILNILTALHFTGERIIGAFTSSTTGATALCVIGIRAIRLTFWYNIDRCRGGGGSIGLAHVGRDSKCINRTHSPLSENTCELGVGGSIELSELALLPLPSPASSIASHRGVAFVGTNDGHIIKMRLKDNGAVEEYGRTRTGRGPVEGILFTGDNDIVVHQGDTLHLLPVADCSSLVDCTSCLLSPDPHCGWCPSSTSCSSSCSIPSSLRCPSSAGPPSPSSVPVGISSNISIPIHHLPSPDGFSYECVFDSSLHSMASLSGDFLVCPSPSFPSTKTTSTVSLVIKTTHGSRPIASHNFTFYDCGQFDTCSSCVSSHWNCSWYGSKCTVDEKCSEPSSQCVQILPGQNLRLPNAKPSSLSFRVQHGNQLSHGPHSCRIRAGGRRSRVLAEISGDTVTCKNVKVDSRAANASYELQLVNDEREEVVDEIEVGVFDCFLLAVDCSSCLSTASSWGCSWCGGRCSFDCASTRVDDPDVICTAPTVFSFHPSSGPLEGGTIVSVSGRDLGSLRSDVEGRILVAGSRCALKDFNVSTGFTCVVEKGTGSGPVRVAIGHSARRTAESATVFAFVDVKISSLTPSFGPQSGGTLVTLSGKNLDAGSHASLFLGHFPCNIRERNSSSLTCVTTSSPRVQKMPSVTVRIDKAIRSSSSLPFDYRPDPLIHSISPHSAFRSGGRLLVVQGSHLDALLSARLFLLNSADEPVEIVSDLAPCHIVNSSIMHCLSPALIVTGQRPSTMSSWSLGVDADGVSSLRRLPRHLSLSIVPDPSFLPFDGVRAHLPSQPLILDGQYLNLAADPDDFKIWVGGDRCVVSLVDEKQLVCSPPAHQPEATGDGGVFVHGELPSVVVTIGRLRYELGPLEYSSGSLGRRALAAVGGAAVAILFLVFVLFILWRRKSEQREKNYKKIQIQMENLESNVRKECKQAFAELQTTMEEGAGEEETGVFLLPKGEFVSRLLWIDGPPPPSTTIYSSSQPATLAQLDSLLCTPEFVVCLVYAADSDPSLCLQEKSLLSSLLVSALSSNFPYLSTVVLQLLREHVESTVQHRSSALVFRQSESLVEMLFQKWFAICMYDSVADKGAPQLQTLHTALKLLSSRGPVDSITGAARYSINESKLLTETVHATPIDLLVTSPEGRGPFAVRVLACDSISQAKRKAIDTIYRHLPASGRPSAAHSAMEWQRGDGECVGLRDTEEGEGRRGSGKGPRRVNTVASVGLTHGSLLMLLPARKTPSSGTDSGQSSWSSLDYSSLPSSYFHLVPPSKTGRQRFSDSIPASIPEVYLTRLLTSKGTVQKFIDDLLEAVLFVDSPFLPAPLKAVCDLLDDCATRCKLADPLLVHQWKANCLVLRFWAQLISNPRLIIDVDSCVAVDANMAIIGQTLMASCSSGEPLLHADSPSSRLLFAREIARLRPLSSDLFSRLRRSPPPPPSWPHSLLPVDQPSRSFPLGELLSWIRGNGLRLLGTLEQRTEASLRLAPKLSHLLNLSIEPEHIYATLT